MTPGKGGGLELLAVLTLPGVERSVRQARLFLRDIRPRAPLARR